MWDESKVRYLHISDLHISNSKFRGFKEIEKAFFNDLDKIGANVDLVFITGDIAFSGKNEEYHIAKEWIESKLFKALDLTWENILVVPGNHDVERDLMNKALFIPLLNSSSIDEYNENLKQIWYHKPTRMFIESKFNGFKNFLKETHVIFPDDICTSWTRSFEKNGFTLSIIGANSAWAAGYDGDDNQNIIIGLPQLDESLSKLSTNIGPEAKLLLFHHPQECFYSFDQRFLRTWINNHFDFVLCGHTHELFLENMMTKHPFAVWITSGAMFLNRKYSHSYNIVDIGPCTVRIKLRRYGPSHEFYGADTLSYQEASENGVLSWQWRKRPRVYIAGSIQDESQKGNINKYIRKLTINLLKNGISVWATSRVPGVGAEVWDAGWHWCEENNVSPVSALGDAGLYPVSKDLTDKIPDLVSARASYIGMQDAIIAFCGGEGTKQEIEAAKQLGIPIIALSWSGGSAKKLQKERNVTFECFGKLSSCQKPTDDWVNEISEQLSSFLWSNRRNE